MSASHTVIPLTASIGAEIGGIDIAAGPDENVMARIRQALVDHSVIFFRNQQLSVSQFEQFSARFGPLVRVPYIKPMEGRPNVIAVLKEVDERRISTFGGEWHSDFSYLESPPVFTLLYAEDVPPGRGDTLWANMYAAWESLSPALRSRLEGLQALHSGHVYGARRPPTNIRTSRSIGISRNHPGADVDRAHPVARLHPESLRKALFVNPVYTTRMEGMSESESAALLKFLYARATSPEFICRFAWTPGSLAIWDNRCTMHLAVNDYDGYRRLLYRTTVASERPVASGPET